MSEMGPVHISIVNDIEQMDVLRVYLTRHDKDGNREIARLTWEPAGKISETARTSYAPSFGLEEKQAEYLRRQVAPSPDVRLMEATNELHDRYLKVLESQGNRR